LKSEPDRIWIADATIISSENLDHIERGSVLIEDGRIVRVDRTQKAKTRRRDRSLRARTISDSRADGLARAPVIYSWG
jgi:imidazolonepropionase-like amidohydrolase